MGERDGPTIPTTIGNDHAVVGGAQLLRMSYAIVRDIRITFSLRLFPSMLDTDRGLGYLMIQVQAALDIPAMPMAVVLLTEIGVTLYLLCLQLERLCLRGGCAREQTS